MTNYIEEMMRSAGVEPDRQKCNACKNCSTCQLFKGIIRNRLNKFKTIEECQKASILYPYFTPAKQLEIIKLICKNTLGKDYRSFNQERDEITGFYHLSLINHEYKHKTFHVKNEDFTQALAQLTTELMKANELDKSKIKEILEG